MSCWSTHKSKIKNLHPQVSPQALALCAEVFCQAVEGASCEVAEDGKKIILRKQSGSRRQRLEVEVKDGQLQFSGDFTDYRWLSEWQAEFEKIFKPVYTTSALVAALRAQGKQTQVNVLPTGQLQVIGQ